MSFEIPQPPRRYGSRRTGSRRGGGVWVPNGQNGKPAPLPVGEGGAPAPETPAGKPAPQAAGAPAGGDTTRADMRPAGPEFPSADARAAFIDAAVRQFLGRAAQPGEYNGFGGMTGDDILKAIRGSGEAQQIAATGKNLFGEPFKGDGSPPPPAAQVAGPANTIPGSGGKVAPGAYGGAGTGTAKPLPPGSPVIGNAPPAPQGPSGATGTAVAVPGMEKFHYVQGADGKTHIVDSTTGKLVPSGWVPASGPNGAPAFIDQSTGRLIDANTGAPFGAPSTTAVGGGGTNTPPVTVTPPSGTVTPPSGAVTPPGTVTPPAAPPAAGPVGTPPERFGVPGSDKAGGGYNETGPVQVPSAPSVQDRYRQVVDVPPVSVAGPASSGPAGSDRAMTGADTGFTVPSAPFGRPDSDKGMSDASGVEVAPMLPGNQDRADPPGTTTATVGEAPALIDHSHDEHGNVVPMPPADQRGEPQANDWPAPPSVADFVGEAPVRERGETAPAESDTSDSLVPESPRTKQRGGAQQ